MAHEITTTAGKAEAFYGNNTPAWHGLGQVVDGLLTSREAIEQAGMGWRVEQWPMRAFEDPNNPDLGRVSKVERFVANVRSDTGATLGVVGESYQPVQNAEAFEFMDSLVADRLAMYETAGTLKGGRTVWILARIPKEYRAGPEDLVKPYVLLTNSHDGSSALRMLPTTVRVVCNNTLTLALRRGQGGIRVRHTGDIDAKVRDARRALGVAVARFDEFDAEMHRLIGSQVTRRDLRDYTERLYPDNPDAKSNARTAKKRAEIEALFDDPKQRLPGIAGTWWAALNAVTEHVDHVQPRRGKTAADKADARMSSTMLGVGAQRKRQALDLALEMAGS